MRWEEIWDSALRIRSLFQTAEIQADIREGILLAAKQLDWKKTMAVRSSSPKEDSSIASFAGLHESRIGIRDTDELLEAVKGVWASLWSDAALLYQRELKLDPLKSDMAVLIQEMVEENISGVAFGADPRNLQRNRAIVEAVPGLCRDLVDGNLEPDRWILKRSSGEITEKIIVNRSDKSLPSPLLNSRDLNRINQMLKKIRQLFGWFADTEWTGKGDSFSLLQARSITTHQTDNRDDRSYYLTLRPGENRLKKLSEQVSGELIPRLEAEGQKMAAQNLSDLNDIQLADIIKQRKQSLERWRTVYKKDFIPFAHGVRRLATYYNDAVRPNDPYEFVGLLRGQSMIATRRNKALLKLAEQVGNLPELSVQLSRLLSETEGRPASIDDWDSRMSVLPGGKSFSLDFRSFIDTYMDVAFKGERLLDQHRLILQNILKLAEISPPATVGLSQARNPESPASLQNKLMKAVGPKRIEEAREVLKIGRLSWKLRDDDNLLLGRIQSQLLRAIDLGSQRLIGSKRLKPGSDPNDSHADLIADALAGDRKKLVVIPQPKLSTPEATGKSERQKPRQLVGQPAAPGIVSGTVRIVSKPEDIGSFQKSEILVCDAIQPNMTHLVLLAGGIIERRGGMLIHGAIIAREMGIPCVNGIPAAATLLSNQDWVTIDGFLGIVTVGEPEFDLELPLKITK